MVFLVGLGKLIGFFCVILAFIQRKYANEITKDRSL